MEALTQALRDELVATRFAAGIDNPRALARILGLSADSGHFPYWRFERGHTAWPRDPDEFVDAYARAAGVAPLTIWQGVARRWSEALHGGDGGNVASRITG